MADCEGNKESITKTEVPIIMKIHSPGGTTSTNNLINDDEESVTSEKDSEKLSESPSASGESLEENCKGPKIVLSQFQLFNPSKIEVPSPCKLKPSLLRPSQLSSVAKNASPSKSVVLEPTKFNNPFLKNESKSFSENEVSEVENNLSKNAKITDGKDETEIKPKFLAFGSSFKDSDGSDLIGGTSQNTTTTSSFASGSTSSFVFGQNLKERVAVKNDNESSDSSEKEEPKEDSTTNNENGSSGLLFSNAAAVCKSSTKTNLTLSEAAQELEEASRSNKRKYNEVALLTGEEDETNVLQINCKLFAFDKTNSSWQERGRGLLRLNDKDDESRLVARATGTQRLVLNTMIWPGMTAERAGLKSLRLTAMDVQGDIKIFVVQAAPKEVDQLHNLLIQRLKRAQGRQPKKLAAEQ